MNKKMPLMAELAGTGSIKGSTGKVTKPKKKKPKEVSTSQYKQKSSKGY